VEGYALQVPGVQDTSTIRQYGVRIPEGTTDALCNQEHAQLNDLATHHAENYNLVLLWLTKS
jgi:hypothetical protein